MKKSILFFLFVVSSIFTQAQTIYQTVPSEILGGERKIKIQVPRGHDAYENDGKHYPLIFTLDGDYMFEIVAGNVDYYAYWQDMPDAIVVGLIQNETRNEDFTINDINGLPSESGQKFFSFLSNELIPHLEKNFLLEDFKMIIGHGKSANFINYFLLRDQKIAAFNSYVAISPDFNENVENYLTETLPKLEYNTFYYTATSDNDIPRIKEKTERFITTAKAIGNKFLYFNSEVYEGPTHYGLPAHSIATSLESTFLAYRPISKKEYKEVILKLETSPVDYLIEKYQTIKDLYGIDKQILINDFKAVEAAIRKNEKWEYFEPLSELALKYYPETLLSKFYLARFYEEEGEPRKAIKAYKTAYTKDEIAGITRTEMLERAEQIVKDYDEE